MGVKKKIPDFVEAEYQALMAKAPPQKKRGGKAKIDPAKLLARGYYRDNPRQAPEGMVPDPLSKSTFRKKEDGELHIFKKTDYTASALQYINDVVTKKRLECESVIQACQRHLDDLAKQGSDAWPYVFDSDAANKFCEDAEQYPHIKGKWAVKGARIQLSPWETFVLVIAFGWKRKKDGLRRFREMYVSVPRKNGKSTLAAAIGNNMLLCDGEHGAEVYAGATSEKQAWEVFGPARFMVMRSPSIITKYGVEVWARALVKAEDNSRFWPIIGKPGDGASPHCAIIDEYHEHQSSDLLDTMVTGMGAREQPMVLIITTAGTNLASPCYDKHLEAKKVLGGSVVNEELFTVIYGIDEEDDWTSHESLRKANPNLGISVDEDFLMAQQRQASQNSAYQNRFKTKHLNVWCAASVAGINMVAWKKCGNKSLKLEDFVGEQVWFALDLASKIDICSAAKVFKKRIDGETHYYAFVKNYLPEDTIEEATNNQQAYRKWVIDGRLIATPGAEIDFDQVREDVMLEASRFQIQEVVYDPWRATQLAHQLSKEGAKVVEVGQTAKNMGEAYDEFTAAIKSGRFHHDGDPVLEWMASNVVSKSAGKGLTVPSKDRKDQKIDGIVAVIMAISRAMTTEISGWLENPVIV